MNVDRMNEIGALVANAWRKPLLTFGDTSARYWVDSNLSKIDVVRELLEALRGEKSTLAGLRRTHAGTLEKLRAVTDERDALLSRLDNGSVLDLFVEGRGSE